MCIENRMYMIERGLCFVMYQSTAAHTDNTDNTDNIEKQPSIYLLEINKKEGTHVLHITYVPP